MRVEVGVKSEETGKQRKARREKQERGRKRWCVYDREVPSHHQLSHGAHTPGQHHIGIGLIGGRIVRVHGKQG
jgi:hypothetical protein